MEGQPKRNVPAMARPTKKQEPFKVQEITPTGKLYLKFIVVHM